MLPPVTVPVLSKVIAPLLTYHQAAFDIVDGELKWSFNLTLPCGAT
jgi:hypothetical protein